LNVKDLGSFHFKNDHKKRNILAIDSPGLVVPERHQLSGKLEEIGDTTKKQALGKRTILKFAGAFLLFVKSKNCQNELNNNLLRRTMVLTLYFQN
jgi:hypothetical protein